MAVHRLFQSLDRLPDFQHWREPPGQHFPPEPVQYGDEIQIPAGNDDYCRENLCLIDCSSVPVALVAWELDVLIRICRKSGFIVGENWSESGSLAIWNSANQYGVDWLDIDSGKPQQIIVVAHVNGRLRDEAVNLKMFDSLDDVSRKPARRRYNYNNIRQHSSLGNQTPTEAR